MKKILVNISYLIFLAKYVSAASIKPMLTLAVAASGMGGLQRHPSTSVEGACVCRVEPTYNPNCRTGTFINVNDHGDDWCWISRYLVRQACEDNELRGECEKADKEIHDWAAGVYSLRDSLIYRLVQDPSVPLIQVATTKRAVTNALENSRNNLGLHLECTLGLQTQTLIDGTHSHCYSPELLKVCKHAKEKAPELYRAVTEELERLAQEDENIHLGFVEAFKAGMKAGDNTIDINCNVTKHNEYEIVSDATRITYGVYYLMPIVTILVAIGS